MSVKELALKPTDFPDRVRHIAGSPPLLFTQGQNVNELLKRPCVAIVGSRKVSAYGKEVTTRLASELARSGLVIISGLALGVDSLAHRAALEVGGPTIAVLPSPLDRIYPTAHHNLAKQIVEQGGALVTEYASGTPTYPMNFVARNRIISALSDAVLITEAAEKSGSLHTARFALEQGKEVLAVPGNITSPTSEGTNNLIKSGARPVTSVDDVLYTLGIEPTKAEKHVPAGGTPHEQALLDLLFAGINDGAELLQKSRLEVSHFNQSLTMLEIRGHIRPLGNNHWALN